MVTQVIPQSVIPPEDRQLLLKPTNRTFERDGVFNPAVIKNSRVVHVFYRAVRQGNYSSIGYCNLDGPTKLVTRKHKPLLYPEYGYESQGMEDPRITKIGGTYYMTYSAYDRVNVFVALATSKDLVHFHKHGVISAQFTYREYKHLIECCDELNEKYYFHYNIFKEHGLGTLVADRLRVWDKNAMFFPKKIDGKFALIHRIHPGIQLVLFEDFTKLSKKFWEDYFMSLSDHIIMDPVHDYESSHIGGGCPPIETPHGWLFIYHAVQAAPTGLVYNASAALLDLNNPKKVLARLDRPLLSPEHDWEKLGVVSNVIFPTGTARFGRNLYIYYGAADKCIGVAKIKMEKLLNELMQLGK